MTVVDTLVRKAGDGKPVRAYLTFAEPYPELGEAQVTFWAKRYGEDEAAFPGEAAAAVDVSAPEAPAGTVWRLEYAPAVASPYRNLAPGRYRCEFRVELAANDYIYYPEGDEYIRLTLTPNLNQ